DEPVDQVEPPIAEHDPLDDFLNAAQTDTASADEPALPELDESPALELDEPVDDFPVPKFDEPVDQVEPPIAEHDPLDDPLAIAQQSVAFEEGFDLSGDEPEEALPVPGTDASMEYGEVDFSATVPPEELPQVEADVPPVESAPEPFELEPEEVPEEERLALDPSFEEAAASEALDFGDLDTPGLAEPASLASDSAPGPDFGEVDLLTGAQPPEIGEEELPVQRNTSVEEELGGAGSLNSALDNLDLSADDLSEFDGADAAAEDYMDADLPVSMDANAVEKLSLDLEGLGGEAMAVIRKLEASGAADDLPELMEKAKELIQSTVGGAQEANERAAASLGEQSEHENARKIELLDVTSLPVGIASAGDLFSMLIDQNVTIPAEHHRVFTTNQDGQSEVEIRVYQGREKRVGDNQHLGSFILEGIPTARRMEPRIAVTFSIDESGILSVHACDQGSGVEQEIRVEDPIALMADPTREDEGLEKV
ncbi:MAG: Hsp70 family protein, partial [bacterium]|nr:Hsp70 family protein [bacterium]